MVVFYARECLQYYLGEVYYGLCTGVRRVGYFIDLPLILVRVAVRWVTLHLWRHRLHSSSESMDNRSRPSMLHCSC